MNPGFTVQASLTEEGIHFCKPENFETDMTVTPQ